MAPSTPILGAGGLKKNKGREATLCLIRINCETITEKIIKRTNILAMLDKDLREKKLHYI